MTAYMDESNGLRADIRWIKDGLSDLKAVYAATTDELIRISGKLARIEEHIDGHSGRMTRHEVSMQKIDDRVRTLEALRWKLIGACAGAGVASGGVAAALIRLLNGG